jgi:DNA repair protein RecO (recombination protein O)
MTHIATSAILIRRRDYGDYDLVLTYFTLAHGKVALIAKAAKKSVRRFGGVLELFSEADISGATGRRSGLPVLQEAALKQPFDRIRTVPTRIAYASYWAELVDAWMEDHVRQVELYHLLRHVLSELDRGVSSEALLSILFQMRLLGLSGHYPNLDLCGVCRTGLDAIRADVLRADVAQGGLPVSIACRAARKRRSSPRAPSNNCNGSPTETWPGRPASDSRPRRSTRRSDFLSVSCLTIWGASPAA